MFLRGDVDARQLVDLDWGELWKEAQKLRRKADDASYWDGRAADFAKTCGVSPYAVEFIERMRLQPEDTVFDMGCGTGALAIPLAKAGHEVYACDFSAEMLRLLNERAENEGIAHLIHTAQLSWDEDWEEKGLPVCDIAVASRSISTEDMRDSLKKLMSRAERQCCITLATDSSPRIDEVLVKAMGRKKAYYPDFIFGMNILLQDDYQPELSYIRSERDDTFESFDHAIEKTCKIVEATDEERDALIAYSREHLLPRQEESGVEVWAYDHRRTTSWAFISWMK